MEENGYNGNNYVLEVYSMWTTILMIAAVVAVFYFFGIRPQKKQERAAAEMRNNLMVGDEVTTIGGIIGKIVSIKEETFVLETTRDHTRIRFLKTAVRNVDVRAEDAKAAREAAKNPPVEEKPAVAAEDKPALKTDRLKKAKAEKKASAEDVAIADAPAAEDLPEAEKTENQEV